MHDDHYDDYDYDDYTQSAREADLLERIADATEDRNYRHIQPAWHFSPMAFLISMVLLYALLSTFCGSL